MILLKVILLEEKFPLKLLVYLSTLTNFVLLKFSSKYLIAKKIGNSDIGLMDFSKYLSTVAN